MLKTGYKPFGHPGIPAILVYPGQQRCSVKYRRSVLDNRKQETRILSNEFDLTAGENNFPIDFLAFETL